MELFYGIYQMATTYSRSADRAGCATLCSLLSKGLIYNPTLYMLNALFVMYGILFTGAVTDVLSLIVAIALIIHTIKHPKENAPPV